MSNQTIRKPPAPKSGRSKRSNKTSRYRRQTARINIDTRGDGKPLIFGWGGHLSRVQKMRLQQRAAYGFFGLVVAAVLGVFAFGWLQQNVLIPNQAIVTVNGTQVSQNTYRKYLAYQAQTLWNKLQKEITEQQGLQEKVAAGDKTATDRNQALLSLIQVDESAYQQATITENSVSRLVDDQLIQQGMQRFEAQHVKFSFALKDSDIQARLRAFKAGFPKGETYQQFLSADGMSEDDVLDGIRVDARRDVMTSYLTSLLVSPASQVHVRRIQVDTKANAEKWLAKLQASNTDSEWNTLAKQVSLDPVSKNVGGDIGWIFRGGTDGAIENWLFSQDGKVQVKVHQLSPVIKDVSGTYNIVEVLEISDSRPVDATQLSSAKADALDHWLNGEHVNATYHITTINQDMVSATRNLPIKPDLNASLPNVRATPTPGTILPSGG